MRMSSQMLRGSVRMDQLATWLGAPVSGGAMNCTPKAHANHSPRLGPTWGGRGLELRDACRMSDIGEACTALGQYGFE